MVFRKFITSVLVLSTFLIASIKVCAANKSILVESSKSVINGLSAPFNTLLPGDTLLLQNGLRGQLLIKNIIGSAIKPIVIINKGGIVNINTPEHYGISIRNSRYIRLTGTGYIPEFYGIQITRVGYGAGIGVNDLTSDFELDHISIDSTYLGGIYAKTDPDLVSESTREKFTQYNTNIHDCRISNTGNEGMYIGNTKYEGFPVPNNGTDTILLPSLLDGVRIYNNIIYKSGWDGIQVSSAFKDCQVYGNIISYDSQEAYYSQMSGILLGGGSKCDCYNNYISNGKGTGIESHGLGGYRIFNNIIVNAGLTYLPNDSSERVYGMYVTDISVEQDSSFYILFNDIINPKTDGIRFSSIKSKRNVVASNLIANPGGYDYYEASHTSYSGNDSYVMVTNNLSQIELKNNYFTRDLLNAEISSIDYKPFEHSPLVNTGSNELFGIDFDFLNQYRPYGSVADIGAIEYQFQVSDSILESAWPLYQNPVQSLLTVKFIAEGVDPVSLYIYDKMGNQLKKIEQEYQPVEIQEIQINIEDLPKGLFLFSIVSGKVRYSGKFIKNG